MTGGAVLLNKTSPLDRCFAQISVGGVVVRCDLPSHHEGAPHASNHETEPDTKGGGMRLEIALLWAYTK